jgi:hypothetical protein
VLHYTIHPLPYLSTFDYSIKFCHSSKHQNVDYLSQALIEEEPNGNLRLLDEEIVSNQEMTLNLIATEAFICRTIAKQSKFDLEIAELI